MTASPARVVRIAAGALLAALASLGTTVARAQVDVLTPELVVKLEPAKERPLTLSPGGDVARFLAAGESWGEGAPPIVLDLDRDGVRDFVVFSFAEGEGTRRAIVIHEWGDRDDAFGKAVFYLIVDAEGNVVEWGGAHRLHPRPTPALDPQSTPPASPPAAPEPRPTGQPATP